MYDPKEQKPGQCWVEGKDEHLLIGVKFWCLVDVLIKRLKIIDSVEKGPKGKLIVRTSYKRNAEDPAINWNEGSSGWRMGKKYDQETDDYVPVLVEDEKYQESVRANTQCHDPNGYDCTYLADRYLRQTNNQYLSVAEVLLREGIEGVGTDDVVFFSHVQRLPLATMLQSLWDAIQMHEELTEETKFFVDLLALRQCQQDFDLEKVKEAIQATRATLIELDRTFASVSSERSIVPQYLRRLFCCFEAFATIAKGAGRFTLLVCGQAVTDAPEAATSFVAAFQSVKQICDVERAECRYPQETAKIHQLIMETEGGFDFVNESVAAAVRAGVTKGLKQASMMDPTLLSVAGMVGKQAEEVTTEDVAALFGRHECEQVAELRMEQCKKVRALPADFGGRFVRLEKLGAKGAGLEGT